MPGRWRVLCVLFAARAAMAFQFQAVAALSPLYMERFGAGLADIGFLIGLYLAPGLVLAVPGGSIGNRLGDRRAIVLGMGLMVAGAVLVLLLPGWPAQVAGRALAGVGGVLLNVLMSKLVTDLFAGREIGTAMGIFVNSWPVGIAAALLALPVLAASGGLGLALGAVALVALAGLALFARAVPVPAAAGAAGAAGPVPAEPLRGLALAATILAGAIWGLYNGALGMVFGFGPAMLAERGKTLAEASATTSATLWLVAVSVPLGGLLADRLGRHGAVMVFGFTAFGALLLLAPATGAGLPVFVALGLVAGLPAGPIMSLPARVLTPGTRAAGLGLFFTLFYAGVVFAPMVAGHLAAGAGTAAVAFSLGAALVGACCLAFALFRALAARLHPAPATI